MQFDKLMLVCKTAGIPLITAEEFVNSPSIANKVGNDHFLVHTDKHVCLATMSYEPKRGYDLLNQSIILAL